MSLFVILKHNRDTLKHNRGMLALVCPGSYQYPGCPGYSSRLINNFVQVDREKVYLVCIQEYFPILKHSGAIVKHSRDPYR